MTKQRTVVLIPEVNAQIGMGHLYRCLSVAAMLINEFRCVFFVAKADQITLKLIETHGFELIEIPDLSLETITSTRAHFVETVGVLDGYSFDTDFQKALHKSNWRFLYIDDLCSFHYFADVVINTADGVSENSYKKEDYTKVCIGRNYTLLRPEFLEKTFQPKQHETGLKHVFVSLGASDPLNLSSTVLLALSTIFSIESVTVLASSLNPHIVSLKELSSALPFTVNFLENASSAKVINALENHDLAIVSASNIANESICVGIPLIVVLTASNQEQLFETLTKNNLAYGIRTTNSLTNEIPFIARKWANRNYWQTQVANQQNWFDGRSPERIRALITELYGT
ncbi:MAG: UDP-2,4-diacetamido-2,4,6-trideoxy-beta-L-altropyranose hydrolase [Fluviicola sp.]|nr:UDP-2,4-diacetamido-2,4,6-trideoxy-beta-L-altropyranose hydrolase [Fluviicola sp.]